MTAKQYGHDVLAMRVDSLDLTVRSLNCLRNQNIVHVRDLIGMSEAELMRWPNMGQRSVQDITEALDRLGLRLGMKEYRIECTNQGAQSEATAAEQHAHDMLQRHVGSLDLTVRSLNCLRRENIVYVRDLIAKSGAELMRWPNMGRHSVRNIEDALDQIGLHLGMREDEIRQIEQKSTGAAMERIDKLESFVASLRIVRGAGIVSIRELVGMSEHDIADIAGGSKEHARIIDSGLRRWGLELGMLQPAPKESSEDTPIAETVREEIIRNIYSALSHKKSNRTKCYVRYSGVDGSEPTTYDEIAMNSLEYGFNRAVSRERVRQVIEGVKLYLGTRQSEESFPRWRMTIEDAQAIAPIPVGNFVALFGYGSDTHPERSYRALAVTSEVFGLKFPFHSVLLGDDRIVFGSRQESVARVAAELDTVPKESYWEFNALVDKLNEAPEIIRECIEIHPGWEYIDDNKTYCWRRPKLPVSNYRYTGNIVLTFLCKIFSATAVAASHDLVQAYKRSRRQQDNLDISVLEGIAERSGLFSAKDGVISRVGSLGWVSINRSDLAVLRVCADNGEIVTSRTLVNSMVRQGLSSSRAAVTVAYSPFLVHVKSGNGNAPGIYKIICRQKGLDIGYLEKGVAGDRVATTAEGEDEQPGLFTR